jgi:hypothetical protein
MDTAALDALPGLIRDLTAANLTVAAAVNRVGDLIAGKAPSAVIAEAVNATYCIRVAMEDGAGKAAAAALACLLVTREESLAEGGERRDAEITAAKGEPPRLRLALSQ